MTRALAEREEELARVRRRVPAPLPMREKVTWVRIAGPLAGLELATMNPSLSEYFGVSEGVLVTRAEEQSPLGLKGGDVILSVDGRKPSNPAHLARILASYEPGETVALELVRSRKHLTLKGTLATGTPEPREAPKR
jgi:S1-C subfamily serine protease